MAIDELFHRRMAIWLLETSRAGLRLVGHLVDAPEISLARRLLLRALEREQKAVRIERPHESD